VESRERTLLTPRPKDAGGVVLVNLLFPELRQLRNAFGWQQKPTAQFQPFREFTATCSLVWLIST